MGVILPNSWIKTRKIRSKRWWKTIPEVFLWVRNGVLKHICLKVNQECLTVVKALVKFCQCGIQGQDIKVGNTAYAKT